MTFTSRASFRAVAVRPNRVTLLALAALRLSLPASAAVHFLDNGTVKVGLDDSKGAAITWLSSSAHPKNVVNHHDPGRLIQQSYYAGKNLDRTADGQSQSWSPWTWNPIQGGGVGSWARVTELKRLPGPQLYGETIPKLWDMPDEEAQALMRQWTGFEPDLPDVVTVRCELVSRRDPDDRWGTAGPRPQEIPACYFTRNFSIVKSYLGAGQWRVESQPPGPPWGKATPPRKAMALFNAEGQGIAVFSPAATLPWNFGPHGGGSSDDPAAGPCMHVAPIGVAALARQSVYRYRYWLAMGTETQLAGRLDALWEKYAGERTELTASGPAAPVAPAVPPVRPGAAATHQPNIIVIPPNHPLNAQEAPWPEQPLGLESKQRAKPASEIPAK